MKSIFVFKKKNLVYDLDSKNIIKDENYVKNKENLINFINKYEVEQNSVLKMEYDKFILNIPINNYIIAINVDNNLEEKNIYDKFKEIFINFKENNFGEIKNIIIESNKKENYNLQNLTFSLKIDTKYETKLSIKKKKKNIKFTFIIIILLIFGICFVVLIIIIFNLKLN